MLDRGRHTGPRLGATLGSLSPHFARVVHSRTALCARLRGETVASVGGGGIGNIMLDRALSPHFAWVVDSQNGFPLVDTRAEAGSKMR
jgi:hypothetical protein